MNLLPILERELRVRSRSRATYWIRTLVAIAALSICFPQQAALGAYSTPAALGRQIFNTLVNAAFLACCCACLLSADSISSERREGTLGLLFLTVVKSFDVLLGKLASLGITGFCALLAFLPVLMIPVLAGGVTFGDALRKGLGLSVTLFFALAAGLLGSARPRERFRALRTAGLLVFLVAFLPFWISVSSSRVGPQMLGLFSPVVLMVSAGSTAFKAAPGRYVTALAVVFLEGWVMVVWAGLLLRKSISDDAGEPARRSPKEIRAAAGSVGLSRWRPPKDEAEPVEWLVYRQYGISAGVWAAAVLAMVLSRWLAVAEHFGGSGLFALLAWPLGWGGALVGGSLMAWLASRFFAATHLNGELELLLTTPIGAATILSDQRKVLRRLFLRPVLLMQVATLLPFIVLAEPLSGPVSAGRAMPDVLGAIMTFANTYLGTEAVCWLGLWFGLKTRGQAAAIVRAAGLAFGVPWVFSLCAALFLGGGLGLALGPLQEALIIVFYLWLTSATKRRLQLELAGTDSNVANLPLDFIVRDAESSLGYARQSHTTGDLIFWSNA